LSSTARGLRRSGLVEEEENPVAVGGVEHSVQVLLRLADVLAHHAPEVDAIEAEFEVRGSSG